MRLRTAFPVLSALLLAAATAHGGPPAGKPASGGRAPAPIVGKPVGISTPHFHQGKQFHHGKHFHGKRFVTTAIVTPTYWPYWYPPGPYYYPDPYYYPPPPPAYYGAPPPPPPGWYFCPAYNAYYPPNVACPY